LLAERIDPEKIHVTGNTGIDALLWALERLRSRPTQEPFLLVTLHRRESFGEPLRNVLLGILDFLTAVPEAQAIWPVHPNPAVTTLANEMLVGQPRMRMIESQDYLSFVSYMASCRVILSDSGGVQEEAPSLGKRVLIARETTERPEAVEAGQNWLIGRDRQRVADALQRAWREPPYQGAIPAPSPYGDGQASRRLVDILRAHSR
jgi:UDP-N-acetylglucosamine 2-epimerase (non-hydrolysing)